ncbi:HD domain-containing protein [Desulfovibrio sp. OttesenSCG-928-I05]|nr:HD domain-containing protein [Desulfovibrio sp. OttesenSCG-928-I05]
MEAFLWGVRGSIPNPTQANQFYGANTTCVEVRLDDGQLLIFDAGTGIRSLSKTLPNNGVCHVFLSHGHSDHVQGLSFFQPFFLPLWTIHLYIPVWLEDMPHRLFDGNSFPVAFSGLRADIRVHLVQHGSAVQIGSGDNAATVTAHYNNHPGGCLAYKVAADGKTFLFSGDHEITAAPDVRAATAAMLENVDVAVVDAAFSRRDYLAGWGHSTWEDWVELSMAAGVGTLVLTHHMQDRTDVELDILQRDLLARQALGHFGGMQVALGREGMRFSLPVPADIEYKASNWLQSFIETLSQYKEESTLLDRILSKTREIAGADAGSFYLVEGDDLVFAYSHNDTLFPADSKNKSAYINMRLPITRESISGYVAATGEVLNLDDVHDLPPDVPYRFNDSFDVKTGYYTKSVLTVPILSRDKTMLGVLQLINSLHPRTGEPQPFSEIMQRSVLQLAREAGTFLEISSQLRDNIDRLLRIAKLHDPSETGPHAERVGAIAAEIYDHYATIKGIPPERARYFKGQIRLAAMLHDIGKVGISDTVLRKPGKLTDEEFAIMRTHAELGAELFSNESKDITEMAYEIALHHHQKWNGKGYPLRDGPMEGEAIPLSARITAIADVFDALVSPRCYKQPWSFEKAQALLREEAGQHFDAELVECFAAITDTVHMIYERFPDNAPQNDGTGDAPPAS